MRSPRERAVWTAVAVLLLAAAAAAWWTAERWTPHAGPWAKQAWRAMTRPGPPPGQARAGTAAAPAPQVGASAAAPVLHKCVRGGRTEYTDQPCPPGSDKRPLDGALSVLPQ